MLAVAISGTAIAILSVLSAMGWYGASAYKENKIERATEDAAAAGQLNREKAIGRLTAEQYSQDYLDKVGLKSQKSLQRSALLGDLREQGVFESGQGIPILSRVAKRLGTTEDALRARLSTRRLGYHDDLVGR